MPYPPAAGWAAAPRFRCRCTRPAAPQDRTERLSGRGACENPVVPSSHTASLLENASKCVVFIAPGFGEFVNRFPHFRVQSFSCDFVKIAGCVPSADGAHQMPLYAGKKCGILYLYSACEKCTFLQFLRSINHEENKTDRCFCAGGSSGTVGAGRLQEHIDVHCTQLTGSVGRGAGGGHDPVGRPQQ